MLKILTAILLVALVGCSSTQRKALDETNAIPEDQIVEDGNIKRVVSEDDIIDVDPEELERKMLEKRGLRVSDGAITPNHVIAGSSEGIVIDADKTTPLNDEQHNVIRDRWLITATNTNEKPKCVAVVWRLMDFEFIKEDATETYLEAMTTISLGEMLQLVWVIDGVSVTPPGSGFVEKMIVRDPVKNAKPGDRCTFLPDEDEIIQ